MPLEPTQLAELLDRYWPALVAWVGGERSEAEDAVQLAFIRLAQEHPAPTNCVAWLFTVTKRQAINQHLSRQKRIRREQQVATKHSNSTCHDTPSSQLEIRDLLSQLDARQREIVIAKIWGDLSFEEIADLLNESKATVWRVYQAGLTRLKELMGDR